MQTLISKAWPYFLILALGIAIYFLGSNHGQLTVQKKWDAQKVEDNKAITKLKGEYDVRNRQHSYEVGVLTSRLQTAGQIYQDELARLNGVYVSRMQQSEKRANVYQRQADTGTLECRSLASHAARLDYSLEQGRQLVEELRATVRLRDSQLIELGNQIKADRKLLQ